MTEHTAESIKELLAKRHANDVWVPECNTGSAHAGCRRMDGWAMPKSWSPWGTVGYEIKVSRGDFLHDRKMTEYAPFCHELYLVTPWKMVDPIEVPEGMGLMYAQSTRLVTKIKAPRHDPDSEKMLKLMSYVLMSRARIFESDAWDKKAERAERWGEMMSTRKTSHEVGRLIRGSLGRRWRKLQAQNNELREKIISYESLKEMIREIASKGELA